MKSWTKEISKHKKKTKSNPWINVISAVWLRKNPKQTKIQKLYVLLCMHVITIIPRFTKLFMTPPPPPKKNTI